MQTISFTENGPVLPPTSLLDVPVIAACTGVGRVLVKLECERPLGNFKVLGGMYAGLRLLADHAGMRIPELIDGSRTALDLPTLICASDGNHGLSVAAAASAAGAAATIYLHEGVPSKRARRIEDLGASIVWVKGTYDDAVEEAGASAARGEGLLVPDTTSELHCPVVEHVVQGYATITRELAPQFADFDVRLTHSFIQAGVGGLAAAIADGLQMGEDGGGTMIVVEPDAAPCVGRALASGKLQRLTGDLVTSAEMLSCGLASASAVEILRRHDARAIEVTEAQLADAVKMFREARIETTASGATGLAGLLHVANDAYLRQSHGLGPGSTILLIVTEGVC